MWTCAAEPIRFDRDKGAAAALQYEADVGPLNETTTGFDQSGHAIEFGVP